MSMPDANPSRLLTWLPRLVGFAGWYIWQLVLANVELIRDIITPGQDSTPGILRLPLRSRTDVEVTLLASLVSLTPGTLTIAADELNPGDPEHRARVIYVHGMYQPDRAQLRDVLYEMERRMLIGVRRRGFDGTTPPPAGGLR